MSSIDDHIKRMEESKTLGTGFEWNDFKSQIERMQSILNANEYQLNRVVELTKKCEKQKKTLLKTRSIVSNLRKKYEKNN